MLTTFEFFNELKEESAFLKKNKKIVDTEIRLLAPQIEMLRALIKEWSNNNREEDIINNLLNDILQKPNIENGKVYEALVYAWLEKHSIQYNPQMHIKKEDCFKNSKKGYESDGIITENGIVFDVKQFGLTLPHIETLRKKIQSKIPENYYLTIGGGRNISARELKTCFLDKIDELAKNIMNETNRIHTDYIYREDKFDIEFRAWKFSEHRRSFSTISEFNLYEWAENNEFYFMYHASQFCINSPYIIFCPYDRCLAPIFSRTNKDEFSFLALRALCRRVFINLVKMEQLTIKDYDGKARCDVSVATAAKKISAIVFMDVSDDFDYADCRTFVFQNPNADYKISRYQIDRLFRNAGAVIDDFQFDNY